MNISKTIILTLALLGLSCFLEAQDLYLVVGQSNAAGRGDLPASPQTMTGVKVLDDNGTFVDALPNLNQYSTIQKTTQTQGYNLGYTFGGDMHQSTGKEIRLVVNARGGTSILKWLPGVIDDIPNISYFDEAIFRVQEALTNYPDSELKGILWHQGESNRSLPLYMSYLSNLVDYFRSELGDVPFVAGQLSYERSDNANFNTNLTTISDSISMSNWVSASGLTTSDLTHFTAASVQTLGERYAAEMLQLIIEEENPCGEQPNVIYPISDSYVKFGAPNDNYGAEAEVLVKKSNSGSNDTRGYIYFPQNSTTNIQDFDQILLKLSSTGNATPNIRLQVLGNNFVDESIMTWNNQATTEFQILYGGTSCGSKYYFDVTDYLKTTSVSNPGFRLITDEITSSVMRFGSKENPDETLRPQLLYFSNTSIDIPTFKIKERTVNTVEEGSFLSMHLDEKSSYKDSVNQYGGLANCNFEFNATGYFRTEKIDSVWYIIDPEGDRFFSAGVNAVNEGGGIDRVTALKNLGINTFGAWSDEPVTNIPYCPRLNVMIHFKNTDQRIKDMYLDHNILPVFEPNFQSWVQNEAANYVAPYLNDPWVLGYFLDNELPFYKEMLFECLTYLTDNDPQYLEAENYMINAFGTNWDISQITQAHEDVYKGHVTETYYSVIAQAIKSADPNHLILGTRLNASAKYTPSVIEATGNHTDIMSINYYKTWEPEDSTIQLYDSLTDIPWLVSEFYTKGYDININNEPGAGWVVPTQEDRASHFENFVLKLMTDPNCVGYHWHRYQDDVSNKGFLDENYNWYQPLVESVAELNEVKYSLRDHMLTGVVNQECNCDSTFNILENNGACDDGDPCTINDSTDVNCVCVGTFSDVDGDGICTINDCDDTDPAIGATGTLCNDNDACTIADSLDVNCNCVGIFQDADADGVCTSDDCDDSDPTIGAVGSACNDNDACTINDAYDASCNCVGIFQDTDADGVCTSDDCDDSDPTIGAVGSACNDNDACTITDSLDVNCNCVGIFQDADADGVCTSDDCDDSDLTIGAFGSACNDNDACTINDAYDASCNCIGTFSDLDGDGVCTADDCDDSDSAIGAVGDSCDDGNPCTSDELYDSNCNCSGGTGNDTDNDSVCDIDDVCPGFDDLEDLDNDGIPDGCDDSCPQNFIDLSSPTITSGANVVDYITTNGLIENGFDIRYTAENFIQLHPGFEVQLGAVFEAVIENCQ